MTLIANFVSAVDAHHPGVNESILQESPIILEVAAAMADNDTTEYTFPAAGDSGLPPRMVTVARHTGGDITNGADATWAVDAGDTLIFQADADGNGRFEEFTHSLAGGTDGAYTAVQVAASINADSDINDKVVAVAGLTANRVSLFPKTLRGAVRVIGGTAQTVLLFPGTSADGRKRTYVSQSQSVILGGTGWSWSYNADTRVLTVQNETGGAVNRVQIQIHR